MKKSKIIEHWSDTKTRNSFNKDIYWLANPLIQRYYNKMATNGCENLHWLNYVFNKYLSQKKLTGRILSLGCGKGELERHIASLNSSLNIEALDISPINVEIASKAAAENGFERTKYLVADIEKMKLQGEYYDAIFFNSSLHHISKIGSILKKVNKAMKRNGCLIINEYVGPNRFNIPQREKKIIQSVFNLIPPRYRTSLAKESFHKLLNRVSFFDPKEVEIVDPSEAINSEAIIPALYRYFDVIEHNKIGGTMFHLILHNIAGHFHKEDKESEKVLDFLCKTEQLLIELGELSNHFALLIAKKK
ncbi:MAG: class I SAM-dependent methyltransferase [Candidatus Cloacimonetes bacterium]|nr:class I SAM-dependent methyltransferase [Candidatus Cloacimonadota bacterium]